METLTVFQKECESQLLQQLAKYHVYPKTRSVIGDDEGYIYLVAISGDLEIYIYTDEPEFVYQGASYIFEVPDYPDANMRIDSFVRAVNSCLSGEDPSDPGTARVGFGRGKPI